MVNPIQFQNLRGPEHTPRVGRNTSPQTTNFGAVFDRALHGPNDVMFSAHAMQRIAERNVTLSQADRQDIARAVDAAASKGARESLLLMDGLTLLVSVPNRTVITAFAPESGHDAVITNIDSVVMVSSEARASLGPQTIGPDPFGGSPRAADR